VDLSHVADAVPRHEPFSKYGNPPSYEVFGQRYHTLKSNIGYREKGIASWYGKKFHGQRTSSGEPYNMYSMTAAHKTLPLPTYARVTNLNNGSSVIVKINDRGPFHDNRLIDLSYAAATRLGIVGNGTGLVEVEAIDTRRRPSVTQTAAAVSTPETKPALYLQAGAFSSRNNAEQLRARLKDLPAAIYESRHRERESAIYRVRIGPIDSVEEADRIASTVGSRGIATYVVVE
jgi:rare lipoprotein A